MSVRLLGAGEHARVVREAAAHVGLDLNPIPWERAEPCEDPIQHAAFAGSHRRKAIEQTDLKVGWQTIIHPTAFISPSAEIGRGVYIGPRVIINAGVRVYEHAIINSGSIIEHDCSIGRGANIAPGCVLGGGVRVGDWAFVGLGSHIRDHIRIGPGCIVGMGSVVICDAIYGETVAGNPAKQIKRGPL